MSFPIKVEDRMHTVKEVAALFAVDTQTVRIWLRDGELKGTKIGRAWRVTREALIAFANKHYGG